jgi:hypothetical protein
MTLRYKILGKPGNLQELSEKISRDNIHDVEIIRESILAPSYGFNPFYPLVRGTYLSVTDKNGKPLYSEKVGHVRIDITYRCSPEEAADVDRRASEKSREWNKHFSDIGLNVSEQPTKNQIITL